MNSRLALSCLSVQAPGNRYPGGKFDIKTSKKHRNVAMALQSGTNESSHTVLIEVDETALPTGNSLNGDWIVSDVAWDGTVEERVSNPSSVDES